MKQAIALFGVRHDAPSPIPPDGQPGRGACFVRRRRRQQQRTAGIGHPRADSGSHPDPDPNHCGLFDERAQGVGAGAVAGMVPVPRTARHHGQPRQLCRHQRLYRRAGRPGAGAVQGSLLHPPRLDLSRKRVLQFRLERGLRHPPDLRHHRQAGVRCRGVRGRSSTCRRGRSRDRDHRNRHQYRQFADGYRADDRGWIAGGGRCSGSDDRGHHARAARGHQRGSAGSDHYQGRFRADPGFLALWREGDRQRWDQSGLHQSADLYRYRRSRAAQRVCQLQEPGHHPGGRRCAV